MLSENLQWPRRGWSGCRQAERGVLGNARASFILASRSSWHSFAETTSRVTGSGLESCRSDELTIFPHADLSKRLFRYCQTQTQPTNTTSLQEGTPIPSRCCGSRLFMQNLTSENADEKPLNGLQLCCRQHLGHCMFRLVGACRTCVLNMLRLFCWSLRRCFAAIHATGRSHHLPWRSQVNGSRRVPQNCPPTHMLSLRQTSRPPEPQFKFFFNSRPPEKSWNTGGMT